MPEKDEFGKRLVALDKVSSFYGVRTIERTYIGPLLARITSFGDVKSSAADCATGHKGPPPLLASSLAILGRVKRGYAELRLDGVLGCRLAKHETATRHTCCVCDGLQCSDTFDKGKPVARRGRKAYGPLEEVAGLPNRQEREQGWNHQEWEPSRALTSALQELQPLAQTSRNEDLANLEPHLEEALRTLERLEQKRGLSDREKVRGGALRMLLTSIEEVK